MRDSLETLGVRPFPGRPLLSQEQAHKLLLPYFPAAACRTFAGMARTLLGGNVKLDKAGPVPYLVAGLSLAPHTTSSYNTCAYSTPACRDSCLGTHSGHNAITDGALVAKQRRTQALVMQPAAFLVLLDAAITKHVERCKRKGMRPAVRLNVYSDIEWELFAPWLFSRYANVQFYDYTKIPGRVVPGNYHLTYSECGRDSHTAIERELGRNVAFVYATSMPETMFGLPVVNGDESDLRFADPVGCAVALKFKRAKGKSEAIKRLAGRFVYA